MTDDTEQRGADQAPHFFAQDDLREEDTELGGSPWPWHLRAQAIKDALPEGRSVSKETPYRFADWDEPHLLAESMVDYLCPAQPLQRRLLGVLRGHDEQLASYIADYWRALALWLEDMPEQPHGAVKSRRMPERLQGLVAAKYGWGVRYGRMKRRDAALLLEPVLQQMAAEDAALSTKKEGGTCILLP